MGGGPAMSSTCPCQGLSVRCGETNIHSCVSGLKRRCGLALRSGAFILICRLPVGDRSIRAEVRLGAVGIELCYFQYLRQLAHVEFHAESRALIRIQLTVFELEA